MENPPTTWTWIGKYEKSSHGFIMGIEKSMVLWGQLPLDLTSRLRDRRA